MPLTNSPVSFASWASEYARRNCAEALYSSVSKKSRTLISPALGFTALGSEGTGAANAAGSVSPPESAA